MRIATILKTTVPALLFTALLGCGGGSSGPATMNVHLVDGPSDTFGAVTLQIKKLEIHGPNGWETIVDYAKYADDSTQNIAGGMKTIPDLLKLTGGISETLAWGATIGVGHYDQMRMLLGSENYVWVNGTKQPLKVPSGMQSGLKFPVSFDVAENTTRDVFIDFDAHRSIFVHGAGMSGQYILRPVCRAYDAFMTGAVTGTLVGTAPGTTTTVPLAGVTVLAEVVGAAPASTTVVRHVVTKSDGTYVLDLLPKGGTYYVVAQPVLTVTPPGTTVTTTIVYEAKASDARTITEANAVQKWDASFAPVTTSGTVQGGITNAVTGDAQDEVVVEKDFGSGLWLIIRSEHATVSTSETYAIDNLPFDTYKVGVIRGSIDAYGVYTEAERTNPYLDFVLDAGTTPVTKDITGM